MILTRFSIETISITKNMKKSFCKKTRLMIGKIGVEREKREGIKKSRKKTKKN